MPSSVDDGSSTHIRNTGSIEKPTAVGDRGAVRRVIVAAGAGNVLEWFDWTIFAVFTPFIAHQFFNPDDPVSGVLSTLAVFAVSFFMRPLGGLVFGRLADRKGRKYAMLLAMVLVSIGSLLIAIAPTYGSFGVVASVWLLLCRLLQGFAHGGEVGGSWTYLIESAPPGRRGLWSSTMSVSLILGTVLATLTGAVLTTVLSEGSMNSWGWRVPFFIGGILSIYALYLRRGLKETATFQSTTASETADRTDIDRTHRPDAPGLWGDLWQNRRAIVQIVGFTAGGATFNYTWSVAAPSFSITAFGMNPQAAMWAGVAGNVVFIAALPLAGMLSDRFGRRFNGRVFGLAGMVLSVPLFASMNSSAVYLALALSLALVIQAFNSSIAAAWAAELLPTSSRAMSFGFAYSLSIAIFGGSAPYLRSWLASNDQSEVFTWIVVGVCLLTFLTCFWAPETKGKAIDV